MGAGGTLGLQKAYLIDTSTFIWIKDYYPLGIFPGLWDWLGKRCEEGVVTSIEAVMDEVHDEGTARWLADSKITILPASEAVARKREEVHEWLAGSGYSSDSLSRFVNGADARLVAQADAVGGIVVTQEKPSKAPHENQTDHLPHVRIPNVCDAFGVRCVDLLGMLRTERVRLKLDSGPD